MTINTPTSLRRKKDIPVSLYKLRIGLLRGLMIRWGYDVGLKPKILKE